MKFGFLIAFLLVIIGCSGEKTPERLPFLGNPEVDGTDTIYPKIADFAFTDQDSQLVTNATFRNKIYVADFIFLSCPTICPQMTRQMTTVYKTYENNPHVGFLSHTIDPERDSVSQLKMYANGIGANSKKWKFVTGKKASIFTIADKSYYSIAYSDSTAPGGFTHSGGLLLIDKNRYIRGVYDGTNASETKRLLHDIEILLNEQF